MVQQQSTSGNPSDGVVSRLSFDPSLPSYYRVSMTALCQHWNLIFFFQPPTHFLSLAYTQWLAIVSLAVLYNIIFVVGRAIFWEINKKVTFLWYFLDYLCDFIYLLDTLVHCHEGELKTYISFDLYDNNIRLTFVMYHIYVRLKDFFLFLMLKIYKSCHMTVAVSSGNFFETFFSV